MEENPYDISEAYKLFLRQHRDVGFIFVQWLDYLGQMRTRCMPVVEFSKMVASGERISISNGNLGTLQNDGASSVCNPVGAIYVEPDLRTLRPMQNLGPLKNAATVMAKFTDAEGEPLALCPRAGLQGLTEAFRRSLHVDFLVGFEIEVTFCKRTSPGSGEVFEPLDTTKAWGTFADQQYMTSFPLAIEIITALQSIGINVQHMHSESGPGQYEFVLPPAAPDLAVDTLVQARQCVAQVAATHNLRATCHPTPFPGAGSGAHAHISFNSTKVPKLELEKMEMHFMASVLKHMPSLCAFTMPQATSYGRVVDNSWSGGSWIAWGTQNREVPLRKPGHLRWEVRCLDGCANMYLAMVAILAAGLHGVQTKMEMTLKDCLSTSNYLHFGSTTWLIATQRIQQPFLLRTRRHSELLAIFLNPSTKPLPPPSRT